MYWENLSVSETTIITKRLLRINEIMVKQSAAKDRPNLKQQLEEQKALLQMLERSLQR
jgi:hypothetical protein